jgi:hypothetical protein
MTSRFFPAHGRRVVGMLSALTLAACAGAPTDATTNSNRIDVTAPSLSVHELNSDRHVFHTREWFAQNAARPHGGSSTGISYHGGSVLQSGTKVVAIYWGTSGAPVGYANLPSGTGPGSADGTLIGAFLRNYSSLTDAAANKNYFNINHTYWGPGGSSTTNLIVPTVTYTSYWNTNGDAGAPTPSSSPTDNAMIALVNWGIANGRIAYDPATVYAIFTGSGVNLGGGFGTQYCAYHTHGTNAAGTFYYAAMPYNQQYVSGCTSRFASPNADVAANSEVNTLAHEIEETTTDNMGNAWFDSRGYENADKCAWTWGSTATSPNGGVYNQTANGLYFLVQQNWVNAGRGGCATGY